MANANIVIAVSIPNNYGLAGTEKPAFPKMHAHRWALKNEDLMPALDTINCRHGYITDASVEDLAEGVDLNSIKTLFVIIEAVLHARRDYDGVSWWATKAFVKKENAKEYVAKKNYSDCYFWVSAVDKCDG